MTNDVDISTEYGKQAFPEETTDQIMERIIDKDPVKHGTSIEVRKLHAISGARFGAMALVKELDADDAAIVAAGGDPNEMLPGNKPRYTVDDTGLVKDHDNGRILNPKPTPEPEAPDAP